MSEHAVSIDDKFRDELTLDVRAAVAAANVPGITVNNYPGANDNRFLLFVAGEPDAIEKLRTALGKKFQVTAPLTEIEAYSRPQDRPDIQRKAEPVI